MTVTRGEFLGYMGFCDARIRKAAAIERKVQWRLYYFKKLYYFLQLSEYYGLKAG